MIKESTKELDSKKEKENEKKSKRKSVIIKDNFTEIMSKKDKEESSPNNREKSLKNKRKSRASKMIDPKISLSFAKDNKGPPPIKNRKDRKSKRYSVAPISFLKTNSEILIDNSSKRNIQTKNIGLIGITNNSDKKMPNIDKIKNNIGKKLLKLTDYELNALNYEEALKIDKRKYIEFYFSLIRTKHIIFTFFSKKDYNSIALKISFFLFSFTLYYAINALFFSDSTMHKIKEDEGAFNFIYQVPQIIYSSLISSVLNAAIKTLSVTEINILEIKQMTDLKNINEKSSSELKMIFIKSLSFYISTSILLLFFWYYLSCFSAIYKNTQLHLIKDTAISFGLSMIYPFGIYLLPGIVRIPALKNNKREKMFMISKILQFL